MMNKRNRMVAALVAVVTGLAFSGVTPSSAEATQVVVVEFGSISGAGGTLAP